MRVGSLIKLKPEWEERYIILHKHTFPGVLDRIRRSNIRNYSIFLGEGMLFSYWEYVGKNFEGDMAAMGKDGITQDWWKLTDPMQEPLPTRKEGEWWAAMEEIYHWSAGREEKEMGERVAFTARIPDGSEDRVIESLRIAYPILAEKVDLKDVQRFSVFHKDRCLYWYSEYFSGNGVEDSQTLPSDLKVEDELNWMPMKQVFYLA